MNLYFYAPPTDRDDLNAAYRVIKKVLLAAEAYLSTNTEKEEVQVAPDLRQAAKAGALEHMDGLVIEGTLSDAQVGFLLAQAIALKKPCLFLFRRGTVPFVFTHLDRRDIPTHIRIIAYQDINLADRVRASLKNMVGRKFREIPRIKFTLRITPSIESYLTYKTMDQKVSKADFLRLEIEEKMNRDADWQKYQNRRSG